VEQPKCALIKIEKILEKSLLSNFAGRTRLMIANLVYFLFEAYLLILAEINIYVFGLNYIIWV